MPRARLAPMSGKVLLLALCALALAVPAAEPATRPVRILLAISGNGTSSLLTSSDGVRFGAPVASWAGSQPAPVRRGSILYVYDRPTLNADGLSGTVHRFAVGAGGSLAEKAAVPYTVQLGSPEDAARATAGSFAPSFAVDENGALRPAVQPPIRAGDECLPGHRTGLRQAPHRDRGLGQRRHGLRGRPRQPRRDQRRSGGHPRPARAFPHRDRLGCAPPRAGRLPPPPHGARPARQVQGAASSPTCPRGARLRSGARRSGEYGCTASSADGSSAWSAGGSGRS